MLSKTGVDKAVDESGTTGEQKLAADLLNELYPPLDPDAAELGAGIDEADDIE